MPTHKAILTTNHKPIVKGTDEGIWRRLRLVPFNCTIPESERDNYFREKQLMPELPGVLNWMLKGLEMYRTEGLNAPKAVKAATDEYRVDMDIVGQWITEECIVEEGAKCTASDLYESYKTFAEAEHGWCMSKAKFGRTLSDRGFQERKGTGGMRMRGGIKLTEASRRRCSEAAPRFNGGW